jgi:hypothetical protein
VRTPAPEYGPTGARTNKGARRDQYGRLTTSANVALCLAQRGGPRIQGQQSRDRTSARPTAIRSNCGYRT